MDFRAFLAPRDPIVLPYFGGTRVDAPDRRLRVDGELALGWHRFRVEGRSAVPIEPASPPDLSALPRLRGHWVDQWIVVERSGLAGPRSGAEGRRGVSIDGRQLGRISLPPDDEPPPLSRVAARRWYSNDLVFDSLEFEDDAEIEARRALEERRPIGELRGVVPSLRVSFGIALGREIANELGVAVSVRELAQCAVAVSEQGREALRAWIDAIVEQRRLADEDARRRAAARRLQAVAGTAREISRHDDAVRRADNALDAARARMLACRRLERGTRLDVTYEVDGTRILSLVDAETLQVLDPGVCLSGEHAVLTLDAMPSVIREAIEQDHLNITRRA